MIKKLITLANHLDKKGLTKEADYLDALIRKVSAQSLDDADESAKSLGLIVNVYNKNNGIFTTQDLTDLEMEHGNLKIMGKDAEEVVFANAEYKISNDGFKTFETLATAQELKKLHNQLPGGKLPALSPYSTSAVMGTLKSQGYEVRSAML